MNIASRIIRSFANHKYGYLSKYMLPTNNIQKSYTFHSSAKLSIKMYMEHENEYAYSVMESKGYTSRKNTQRKNTIPSTEEFERLLEPKSVYKEPKQLYEAFSMLCTYCSKNGVCISDSRFDNFIDSLTDNIKLASDSDLQLLFYSLAILPETESIRTRNYIEVWAALDDECLNRILKWSHDELLSFVALFYMINVARVSDFSRKSLHKLAAKAKQLTSAQLVQTMFFIGVMRKPPFDMHDLELHLINKFEEFTVDDLAILSMGFFKSKTPIRSMELVSRMIHKVIADSKNIHEVALAALLKVIRYSMKKKIGNDLYNLLDALQHEIPRLSVMCSVHLALLGTTTLTLHKECLTAIAETLCGCMSQARLKDLERLVLTFGTFSFKPTTKECFFQKVLDELRKPERQAEIEKYGKCFACCISYMGLMGIYPQDLMSKILDPKFLEKTYGKQCYLYGREILTLHNTAKIFCGEVEMNRLSDRVARILAKRYTDYVPNPDFSKQFNVSERMFLDILHTFKEMRGGDDYAMGDHILTHHQRGDVILCNNQEGDPLPVKEVFGKESFGLLRLPPNDNQWIAIVVAGRNNIIHNTDKPTGHFEAKVKELRALGWHPAVVPWSVYDGKSKEDIYNYLKNLIKEAIK